MYRRSIAVPVSIAVLSLTTLAPAQTKISGTVQCGKPDEVHALAVGDELNHSLTISKGKCTWTKPMKIAGTQTKEDDGTNFDDVKGGRSAGLGYVVGTMDNGDKMYVRIQSTATMKDGNMLSADGTFQLHRRDGKVEGHQGPRNVQGRSSSGWNR